MDVMRRVPALVVVAGVGSLVVLGLAQAAPSKRSDDPAAPAACTVATTWKVKGNCGMLPGTNFLGTTDARPLVLRTNKAERMRIDPGGKVGIGTAAPADNLVVDIGAAAPSDAGLTIQGNTSSFGDLGLKISNLGPGGAKWYLDSTNNGSGYGPGKLAFVGPGSPPPLMTLTSDNKVGIGTTTPYAPLTVQGQGAPSDYLLTALGPSSSRAFEVRNDGSASFYGTLVVGGYMIVGQLAASTTFHVCYNRGYLATCSSAAEYVPTVNTGTGFPTATDLVSIAPTHANPSGDHHSPFVVAKSNRACDPNLLGFLLNPKSGADGKMLNNRYLPLGIYGYFPAKVTMQGGAIHRGDAITSSSTPGYGMKATGACKTIGYALQDATTSGTIQVFASQGETTAPAVTRLQTQVQTLRTEVQILKRQNASLSARMAAIAQTLRVSARTTARAGGHAG